MGMTLKKGEGRGVEGTPLTFKKKNNNKKAR
jgi:hypothetical protein